MVACGAVVTVACVAVVVVVLAARKVLARSHREEGERGME